MSCGSISKEMTNSPSMSQLRMVSTPEEAVEGRMRGVVSFERRLKLEEPKNETANGIGYNFVVEY